MILLAVGGILIALAVLFFAGWQLFGTAVEETPVREQPTLFPPSQMNDGVKSVDDQNTLPDKPNQLPVELATSSPESTEPPLGGKLQADWRDEIVEVSSPDYDSVAPDNDSPTYSEPSYTENPPPTYQTPTDNHQSYYLPPPTYTPSTYTPPVNYYPTQLYPELSANQFTSCGRITLPNTSSESRINRFIASLGRNSATICLGKAIAEDCRSSEVRVSGADISGYLYVTERNDGVCALGSSVDDDTATFCSVEGLMNSSTEDQKSFREWQASFANDPGQTFVDGYQNSLNLDETVTASVSDCIIYKI